VEDSIKCWEVLEELSDSRLLKKGSAPWSYSVYGVLVIRSCGKHRVG
jgi:hypothetical protein